MLPDQDRTILITGGTGFVGSHLIEELFASGYKNIHTTVFRDPPDFLTKILPSSHFHEVNLTDKKATEELIKTLQPDEIYHLASFAAVGSSFGLIDEILSNNIQLQVSVLNAVKEFCSTARILIVSSADIYGLSLSESEIPITEAHPLRPINPYAVSKATQELLAYSYSQAYKLDVVIARPFNHFGERQSPDFALPAFITQVVAIENGDQEKLMVGNLSAVRDFSDVKDIVKAYVLLMQKGQTGQVYNLGSGVGITMQEVVDKIISKANSKVNVETDPSRLRPSDIPIMIADISKVSALGWQPQFSFDQTLERAINWYRNNYNKEQ